MEEPNTTPNEEPSTANNGQVMDIQAPKPINVTENSTDTPAETANTEVVVEAPVEPTSEVPATEPATTVEPEAPVVESQAPVFTEVTPEESTPVAPADLATPVATTIDVTHAESTDPAAPIAENPLAIPQQPAIHKTHSPILAILLALVVAVVLAGVVIFMYLRSKDGTVGKADTKTSNSQTIVQKPLASVSDVDATTKELETSLSQIDENKDFATTDLSDTSLGL